MGDDQDLKKTVYEMKVSLGRIEAMLKERCQNHQERIHENTADIDTAFKMIRKHERLVWKVMGAMAVLSLFVRPFIQRWLAGLLGS